MSSSTFRFPALFVSHGTPMLAYGESPVSDALSALTQTLPKPKALLFVSSHALSSDSIHVLSTEKNTIQHDFSGFQKDLYSLNYPCPGSPALADQVAQLLSQAQFQVKLDRSGPLDHGIWIPSLHLYPKADIPVIRVSIPTTLAPAYILKMGHTLSKLREEGIMLIGSGGAVHNLSRLEWSQKNGPAQSFATQFESWIIDCLTRKDVESLILAEEHPNFFTAHPTSEHYLPLLFTVGSSLPQDDLQILHRGIEYSSLSMLCFSLNRSVSHELH